MSYDMTFSGRLQFGSKKEIEEAMEMLDEDGCWEESALAKKDFVRKNDTLTVDNSCSAPASFWDSTLHVLETLAEAATAGEIVATYDSGEGPDSVLTERIGPDVEDDEDE